jgi:AAA15 family ATPase/GTPase
MISKLILKNFRCFQNFTLEGIRPVTLIAGANNVGKSTILDAIFLFIDRNSSDVFFKLNNFRGVQQFNLSPKTIWEPLYANMNTENNISIAVSDNGKIQTVTISKDDSFSLSSVSESPVPLDATGIGTPISNSYPLKLNYKDSKKNDISHFILTERGITWLPQKPITTKTPYTQYLSSKISLTPIQLAEWFGKLEMEGKRSKCVEVLQILEPRIKDLSVVVIGGISGIYADLGLPSRLSINMLGDGINKLMYIALTMLANPGSIVLIDEIENGFHYSFFSKLWEIIGKLAEDTQCQIFATTHSYECSRGALPLAVEKTETFRFIRLDKIEGKIQAHPFDNDSFEYSIKNEWEVR